MPRSSSASIPAGPEARNSLRARPLTSYEVALNLIAATTTSTGLSVNARLDEGT
jgi:hypothetical protein